MENCIKPGILPDEVTIEFRKLKNNIFQLLKDQAPCKSIMVASSIHMEGNSITSINLSHVIAEELHSKVLLIDLNFRSKSKHYGKNQPKGLSDFFQDGFQLESIIKRTNLQNLFLLPSGSTECDPPKIVESKEFSDLMDALKKEFSYIIIDSSPFQYYPESIMLASKVDGVILVVQAEGVRREIVIDTKKKLNAVNANILGVVLNRKKHYIPKSIYTRL